MGSRVLLLLALALGLCAPGQATSLGFTLNEVGYAPLATKHATVSGTWCGRQFELIDQATGAVVLNGTTQAFGADPSGKLCRADFSALSATGSYVVALHDSKAARSAAFPISDGAMNAAFRMAMAGFYLARCGQDVPPLAPSPELVTQTAKGRPFGHGACHLHDGLVDDKHTLANAEESGYVNGTGGWHDAGDFGKYTVNTGFSIGVLLYAYEHHGEALSVADLGLPASVRLSPAVPDFLDEVRWGMAWMLKTLRPDGLAYHKLTPAHFAGFSHMPEDDASVRFFAPPGTAATADVAASGAQAARAFSGLDPDFAGRCLEAARRAYAALAAHPESLVPDLSGFSTGPYVKDDPAWDPGVRLWAAAELFETTGEARFLEDAEELLRWFDAPQAECVGRTVPSWPRCKVSMWMDWNDQRNLGAVRYLTLSPARAESRDAELVAQTREQLLAVADLYARTSAVSPWGNSLGSFTKWGINGELARQALLLTVAERLGGAPNATLEATATNTLALLLGRNSFGRSFVTKLGRHPAAHPHHRPSIVYSDAWPGYLVGGPNGGPAKWSDGWLAFRSNEVAINWQAGLAYAAARHFRPTAVRGVPSPAARGGDARAVPLPPAKDNSDTAVDGSASSDASTRAPAQGGGEGARRAAWRVRLASVTEAVGGPVLIAAALLSALLAVLLGFCVAQAGMALLDSPRRKGGGKAPPPLLPKATTSSSSAPDAADEAAPTGRDAPVIVEGFEQFRAEAEPFGEPASPTAGTGTVPAPAYAEGDVIPADLRLESLGGLDGRNAAQAANGRQVML